MGCVGPRKGLIAGRFEASTQSLAVAGLAYGCPVEFLVIPAKAAERPRAGNHEHL